MNKTVSVSIGGFAFILGEDAHGRLEHYLEKVRLNLGSSPDAEEIISDVEGRIAELLMEYLKAAGRQVIDLSMVDKVIAVMGAPEDFNVTGEPVKENPVYEDRTAYRALYRETEDRYLGGVCAGIAHYLGWDPLIVRLIFLLLFLGFGSGVIVYLVMWIFVPEAKTTSEKLRMRGRQVNFGSIKSRFEAFGAEVTDLGKDIGSGGKTKRTPLGKRFEDAVLQMGRVFATVVGIFLLLLGATLCFWLVVLFASVQLIPSTEDNFIAMTLNDPTLIFDRSSDFYFLYWGSFALLLLIIISIFRAAIKLLFRIPLRNRIVNISSVAVALLSVGSVTYGGLNLAKPFMYSESVKVVKPMESRTDSLPVADTLYITVPPSPEFTEEMQEEELIKVKERKFIFGYPRFDIRRSESPAMKLEVERYAHGGGKIEAVHHAENISYPVEITGDSILLQPVFTAPLDDKFRAQQAYVRLFVPNGTVVYVSESSLRIMSLGSSETNAAFWMGWPYDSIKGFIMEKEGLRVL